ncbi:MAG: deoxyhypusine synthase family protein [Candidatus Omnitrophica bacterium]|nr:deoxyhypusine synthase family protein [Candidatus Omnitrophota bacterium]
MKNQGSAKEPKNYSDWPLERVTDPEMRRKKRDLLAEPVHQVDLTKAKNIAELLDQYANASIQARNLGLAAKVFGRMLTDEERPTILLGLAGPLIAAGLRKVIRDLIHYNLVDVVVSTGAILYQDYYAARGGIHSMGNPEADDVLLRDLLIDRIYDTYVDEEKFQEFDTSIARFADTLEPRNYSSREFILRLSETIQDDNSILVTARKKGIPIFCPAINDSSIGIGLTEHYYVAKKLGRPRIAIDSIRDNYELTQIVVKSKRTSAIYVAGGVPKNYINDSVVMGYIFGCDTGGHKYAIQVTTDVPHWGGLSGSTLSEARSWGKVNKKANFAMAFVEPSVSLPLLTSYALQKKLYKNRSRIRLTWKGDVLEKLETVGAALRGRPNTKSLQGAPT